MVKQNLRNDQRVGFSILELQVAFVLLGIALAGLGPLVVMQLKQVEKLEGRFNERTTYYLVPSSDEWARKLGAVASVKTQDPGPPPPPPIVTIDNGEAGYSESGTGWGAETQPNAFRGNHRWHPSGTGSNTASWQFTGLPPGWYDIRVTWLEAGNRATDAPFTVYDGATQKGTFNVNQQEAPSGGLFEGRPWHSLAILPINSTTAWVVLNDQANGRVIADGVRVVPVRNDVRVQSLDRSLISEEVTVHLSVTVLVPQ